MLLLAIFAIFPWTCDDGHKIKNSNVVKLLGISIDYELKFTKHVSKLCKKASQKLHALSRISPE